LKLVLCHGTFDLLHVGHLRFLEAAGAFGDRLVVTLTADEFVNKGPGRPIFGEAERAYAISRIKGVDEVAICRGPTGIKMIEKFKPSIYVKGGDYKSADKHGNLDVERIMVEAMGGRLVILDTPLESSTGIIERVAKWREQQNETGARSEGGLAQREERRDVGRQVLHGEGFVGS
jgi:rfaE bifunctional protein nucleotidyltransferase chain/domain